TTPLSFDTLTVHEALSQKLLHREGALRRSSSLRTLYRNNTVYFITSKVRDGLHHFREERAKQIFWDRFTHWSDKYGFEPWVVSLLSNHYHIIGCLPVGENLGHMMQRIHGSTSKLVNDTLPVRHLRFWRFEGKKDYFDGCLRDETQLRRTYRYVQRQAVRAGLVRRVEDYPHAHSHHAHRSSRAGEGPACLPPHRLLRTLRKPTVTTHPKKRRGRFSGHA
ncbi:MAG TPA: transposase, partial [Tepidisphaeraceae bacterium]